MSVRAFGCESVYGLKLLTLGANDDKLVVWIPACLDKQLLYEVTFRRHKRRRRG